MTKITPKNNFVEYLTTDYREVNELLKHLYPNDMNIEVYEGSIVNNYIGFGPHDLSKFDPTEKDTYDWIVVAEEPINEWSSLQRVYFTNDEDFVNNKRNHFKGEVYENA